MPYEIDVDKNKNRTKQHTIRRPDAMQLLRDDMIPFHLFFFIIIRLLYISTCFGPVIDLRVTI